MAFKQYTSCIPASNTSNSILARHHDPGAPRGSSATVIALGMSPRHGVDGRSACSPPLGSWRTAGSSSTSDSSASAATATCIGVVSSTSGTTLTGLPDNDFNVNLVLRENEFGADRTAVENSTPYGFLVQAHPSVTARGLNTAGHHSTDKATPGKTTEDLHCEFEGGGVYYLLLGSYVAFAAAVAGLILCVYLPPIPGLETILQALTILLLLALLLGFLVGLAAGGSSSDVNPNLGAVHTDDDPNGGQGAGADILYISGTWVFDPWHEGWNEIHPVKVCTRIGTWDGDWDAQPPDVILRPRTQFEIAAAPETQAAQKRPENRWVVHPALDGCATDIIT